MIKQFEDEAPKELYDAKPAEIIKAFQKFCETKKGKEERFVRNINHFVSDFVFYMVVCDYYYKIQ